MLITLWFSRHIHRSRDYLLYRHKYVVEMLPKTPFCLFKETFFLWCEGRSKTLGPGWQTTKKMRKKRDAKKNWQCQNVAKNLVRKKSKKSSKAIAKKNLSAKKFFVFCGGAAAWCGGERKHYIYLIKFSYLYRNLFYYGRLRSH